MRFSKPLTCLRCKKHLMYSTQNEMRIREYRANRKSWAMARIEEIRKAQRVNTAIVEDHPLTSSRNSSNDRLVSEIEENLKKIIHLHISRAALH
jgi:hypothetical protein